jgi:hypothetical protein
MMHHPPRVNYIKTPIGEWQTFGVCDANIRVSPGARKSFFGEVDCPWREIDAGQTLRT